MIRKLLLFLFIPSFISFLVISCGTTKGYIGEKLPDTELAIVNGSSNNITISKRNYTERVLLAKVDSLEVGNFFKGWPRNVKVNPGEHIIEVRHLRPWNNQNTYYGGGAIGGAIAATSIEQNMTHYHYLIKFNLEKNQTYLISIKSNPDTLDTYPLIEIFNTATNEIIKHESEEKIINPK